MLLGGVSIGMWLGARDERSRWEPLHERAVMEVERLKSELADQSEEAARFAGRWRALRNSIQRLQDQIEETVGSLDNPRFPLWNSCGAGPEQGCPLTPGREYVGGVPDTFTYHLKFRATVPVTVRIMSTDDYVCWKTGLCSWRAVTWKDRTEVSDGVFHQAEGCAGYLAIFSSDRQGTLYPDVAIERNPAPRPTGACR